MDLSYENLSRLVTTQNLLSRLQDLNLDGGNKIVSFQWLGPHFLTFLQYAEQVCFIHKVSRKKFFSKTFNDLLKHLDDSASDCILYGESKHYKNFLEIILSFMPELKKFFTIQKQVYDRASNINNCPTVTRFIDFLLETIGKLLNCQIYSSVLVSNQVNVLQKDLKFLLTFLLDTMRWIKKKQDSVLFIEIGYESKRERIKKIFEENIFTEIEDVSDNVGLFLHSFFFTTDLVIATKMDLAISLLLERIEFVKVKIKDYCIAVSMKMNCGIGNLQVAESSSEVSSSLDKSIPMVEEMIVGFEDMATQIVSKLLGGPSYRQIIAIVGMGGLGKTTLAKKIYNDFNARYYFDKLSWCVVSQTYQKRKLLIDILSSTSDLSRGKILKMEDEELAEHLYRTLIGRRYLIVIDDLWDIHAWDDLKRYFPDNNMNRSRVLFTSRLKNMALEISHIIIEPPLLSPSESWNLLEQKLFKKESCPQELQDIGKQIAKNCHGLPLSVVTIAGILSNMEKKEILWQQVATNLTSYISQKADDYIPTLKLSYMHLPNHLKPCFLYLSAFHEDEDIQVRKLLLLWIAEGFIEKKEHKTLEEVAEEYLMELINRSLLQVSRRRSDNKVRACTIHDLVLDMCWKIAEEETFLFQHQFLISKHHHRLCMNQSHHLSEALSVLYNSEKIRILVAWYDENVDLGIKIMPDLRYLAITYFDSAIGMLQNLEFLRIINIYHQDIPMYLLNMPKLRHLCVGDRVTKSRFNKDCDSFQINHLQTLSFVFISDSKDEEILRCSPNLRMLKCRFFGKRLLDLNFLSQLRSLKMVYESRFRGDYKVFNLPRNIKKLTLSNVGLPWEKMSLIGLLPILEVLKLEDGAFEGKIWDTKDDEFQKLKFLKLVSLDIEQWNSSSNHFPVLKRLVLQFVQKLEMIPSEFSNIPTLQKIEVRYCSESVESSALEIREEQKDYGNEEFELIIQSLRRKESIYCIGVNDENL